MASEIEQLVTTSYGFPFHRLPLEWSFVDDLESALAGDVPKDLGLRLRRLFDRTTTNSTKEDLLSLLRNRLLLRAAVQMR